MTAEDIIEFTEDIIAEYYQHRTTALLSVLAEECIWQTPGKRQYSGVSAIRKALEDGDAKPVYKMKESRFRRIGDENSRQVAVIGNYTLIAEGEIEQQILLNQRATFCYYLVGGEYSLFHVHISNEWEEASCFAIEKRMEHPFNKKRVMLQMKSGIHVVNASRLLYIETADKQCILHMQKECIPVALPISRLESCFPYGFCRIHRCYIVNCAYISSIKHFSVTLQTGEILPIPEKRYTEVLRRLMEIING